MIRIRLFSIQSDTVEVACTVPRTLYVNRSTPPEVSVWQLHPLTCARVGAMLDEQARVDGVPALTELCCKAVAAQLLRLPCTLDHLPPRASKCILRHAIASGTLEEEQLSLFGLTELVLKGSKVTDKGLERVAATCGARLLALDLSQCVRLLSDAGVASLLGACPMLQAPCEVGVHTMHCTARAHARTCAFAHMRTCM